MDVAMRVVVGDHLKALQQLDFDAIKALPAQKKETALSLGKVKVIQSTMLSRRGSTWW